MTPPVLIFTHIPKTGGITLQNIIQSKFQSQNIWNCYPYHLSKKNIEALTKEQIDQIQCIMGHCAFRLHSYLSKPSQYITIVRDPIGLYNLINLDDSFCTSRLDLSNSA